jgi:hypothetical protein
VRDPQAGRLLHAILNPFAPTRDLLGRPTKPQQAGNLGEERPIRRQSRLAAGPAAAGHSIGLGSFRQVAHGTAVPSDFIANRTRRAAQFPRDHADAPAVTPPQLDDRTVHDRQPSSLNCHRTTVTPQGNQWCSLRMLNPPQG